MPTITSGSSQTFTAGVRDATFTVVTNGGTYASVSGADTVSIGPIQTRRTFGPYAIGQSITVSAISGDPAKNGLIDGNAYQVVIQLYGIIVVAVYDAIVSLILLKLIDLTIGLRVDIETEREGLDLAIHGEAVQ